MGTKGGLAAGPTAGAMITTVIVVSAVAPTARAWSYESAVSDGCHERITAEALRRVRTELGLPRIEPNREEQLLIEQLPFSIPADVRDMAGATLLIGVRRNDIEGHDPLAVHELAHVHGDPDGQDAHCLRRTEHDGANGIEDAIAECRAYIRDMVGNAIARGVDWNDGLPDPSARTYVPVHIIYAGTVAPELPIAYVYLGQALHALQDSFTHTYRSSDGMRVTTVLNWVDYAGHGLDEERDGPAHDAALDRCDGVDGFRTQRMELAIEASADLLRAALEPTLAPEERIEAVEAVQDKWLSYEPGCDADNHWCDAPERAYAMPGAGCAVGGPLTASAVPVASAWLILLGLAGLRRRRRVATAALVAVVTLSAHPGTAKGQSPAAGEGGSGPGSSEGRGTPLGAQLSAGAAIDHAAVALALGVRLRVADNWLVGLDVELNPWVHLETQRIDVGTLQGYVSLIHRYRVGDGIAIRTTGQLGVSKLLFEVYGVDPDAVGLYAGINLVGLEIDLGNRFALIVDPAHVAVPIPQVKGAPLAYRQYRLTLGLQWGT